MIRPILLSPMLLLAACATPAPRMETVAIAPPCTLLTCKAAPAAPKEATRQSDVARYIVRLHEAVRTAAPSWARCVTGSRPRPPQRHNSCSG